MTLQFGHPPGDFINALQKWLKALYPQSELLDKSHRLESAPYQANAGGSPFVGGGRLAHHASEVLTIPLEEVLQRREIRSQQLDNPAFAAEIGHRDLDSPVEAKLAGVNPLQEVDRRVQDEIGRHHAVAKTQPRFFDTLRRGDFLFPAQERNLSHLHQIDTNGIVDLRRPVTRERVADILVFRILYRILV